MKNYKVHLTRVSSNRKTGPIPVSTTEMSTCPDVCPLKKTNQGGCYAEGGPLYYHWLKVSDGTRAISWEEFCRQVSLFPEGQLWRHNQAGDLPGDGEKIDKEALEKLVEANGDESRKRGFTYTHYPIRGDSKRNPHSLHNLALIQRAVEEGFIINLSANDLEDADELCEVVSKKNATVPVTSVIHGKYSGNYSLRTPRRRKVVVCPASYRDDVSCATCKLCAVPYIRDSLGNIKERPIIAFPAHGRSAKRINSRLELQGD